VFHCDDFSVFKDINYSWFNIFFTIALNIFQLFLKWGANPAMCTANTGSKIINIKNVLIFSQLRQIALVILPVLQISKTVFEMQLINCTFAPDLAM
jgi:hypothetical protein